MTNPSSANKIILRKNNVICCTNISPGLIEIFFIPEVTKV